MRLIAYVGPPIKKAEPYHPYVPLRFRLTGRRPASTTDDPPKPIDPKAIVEIRLQIEDLKAKLSELEAKLYAAAAPQPALPVDRPGRQPNDSGAAPEPPLSPPSAQEEPQEKNGVPVSRFRMFGDVGYAVSNEKGRTNSFPIGTLDLFMTGALSERVSILGEMLFIPAPTTPLKPTLNGLLLQYKHNDYFNFGIGRYHSSIGYYNTAFQGAWSWHPSLQASLPIDIRYVGTYHPYRIAIGATRSRRPTMAPIS